MDEKLIDQQIKGEKIMPVDEVKLNEFKVALNRNDWVENDYLASEAANNECLDKVNNSLRFLGNLITCSDDVLNSALSTVDSLRDLIQTERSRRGL